MTPMCAAPTTMKRTVRAATPAAAMAAETTAATDDSQPAQLPCKKAEGFALSSLSPFVKSVKKYGEKISPLFLTMHHICVILLTILKDESSL